MELNFEGVVTDRSSADAPGCRLLGDIDRAAVFSQATELLAGNVSMWRFRAAVGNLARIVLVNRGERLLLALRLSSISSSISEENETRFAIPAMHVVFEAIDA
jgi:hypothetical protein